jgi:hypothetical protein
MGAVMQRPTIAARMTKLKNGFYKVQCGHDCSAPLGEAWPPQARGVRIMDLYPRDGGDPRQDWVLHAPRNRNVSAARNGFSRRHESDGTVVYTIIRPKPKRDALGRTVLDERGRPVPRAGGTRPEPAGWASAADHAAGIGDHIIVGHAAPLPAVVECWRCKRLSRVSPPE